ncbi:retinol dehydrogenase 12 [Lepisosteus oculatus]|uniref:Si:dkey-94e7.2 n=1 Tax=Lepisosteus oculatus TaxID=7918 RepID=W5N7E3_LEPOC|nr:PREDICTED: retinol dehydrogenase 12-like [Lepisosteus oculatus]
MSSPSSAEDAVAPLWQLGLQSYRDSVFRGMMSQSWSSDARLDGKMAIVTGANSGIGKETARDLARRGARVILACRDMDKAKVAANEIIKDTGSNSVIPCRLDLSDTKSICEFAEQIYNSEKSLHFLINNAGVAMCPYATTTDGYEMQFGVNHLGHFFLTYLLLDLLKQSAPSRVINVSSITHSMGRIQFDDVNSERSYHPVKAYVQSKLANVLFTRELASRLQGTGVTAYAVDPGIVYTDAIRHMKTFFQVFIKAFSFLIKTPAQGAYTTLYCVLTPDLESGGYYRNCAPAICSRAACDDQTANKLWGISCCLLGIRWK